MTTAGNILLEETSELISPMPDYHFLDDLYSIYGKRRVKGFLKNNSVAVMDVSLGETQVGAVILSDDQVIDLALSLDLRSKRNSGNSDAGNRPQNTQYENLDTAIDIEDEAIFDNLRKYRSDVRNYCAVQTNLDRTLFIKAKEGDIDSRNMIVESNLPFVISYAKKFQNRGLEYLDLIQEGNLGLIEAVYKFDPDRGFKFLTYAGWRVLHRINRAIENTSANIRLPVCVFHLYDKVQVEYDRLRLSNDRVPTVEDISKSLNISASKVKRCMDATKVTISLSRNIDAGESANLDTILDLLPSGGPGVDETVSTNIFVEKVKTEIEKLSDKESTIVKYKLGMIDGVEYTLDEVGLKMGLSRERIRQLLRRSYRKLRQALNTGI